MSLTPWELDITDDELPEPLRQTRNKVVNVDYLGVGLTVNPRFILVEESRGDGATLVAEWNGTPASIAINDYVICTKRPDTEYLLVQGGSGNTPSTSAGYFATLLDVSPTTPGSLTGTGGQLWRTDSATETFLEPTDNPGLYSEAKGTGLLSGGELNIVSLLNIEVIAGTGLVIDSYTDPNAVPVTTKLSWATQNEAIVPPATSADIRWFTIDVGTGPGPVAGTILGVLKQYTSAPTPTDLHTEIMLGYAVYDTTAWKEVSSPYVVNNNITTWNEWVNQVWGPLVIQSGGEVTEDSALFSLNQAAGTVWEQNRNWHVNKTDPNREALAAATPINFKYTNRDFTTIGTITSVIDPSQYDNGGTVGPVGGGSGNSTIQRIFLDAADNYWTLWGQNIYPNFDDALSSIGADNAATVVPLYLQRSIFLGYIISRRNQTNWNSGSSVFVTAEEASGGGGGGGGVLDSARVSKLYNSLGTGLAVQADESGNLTPGVGDTVVFKLTDTAGVSKLIVRDSAGVDVAAINSDGMLQLNAASGGAFNFLKMVNNGGSYFLLENTATGYTWFFTHSNETGNFVINSSQYPNPEFDLSTRGDLTLRGAGATTAVRINNDATGGQAQLKFGLKTDTTDRYNAVNIKAFLGTTTHATRAGKGILTAFYTTTERDAITWLATATGVEIELLGNVAVSGLLTGSIAYTPAVLADWDGGVDPGNVDDGLDQLAARVTVNEGKQLRTNELRYTFNSTITYGDPGAGKISYTTSAGPIICINDTDADGSVRDWLFKVPENGTYLVIMDEATGTIARLCIASSTATDQTGWWSIPVGSTDLTGTLTNGMAVLYGHLG